MIADLGFSSPDATGVRRARFTARAGIPLGTACLVANGIRETLRELFGERCELGIGEPAAVATGAWAALAREAHCFLTAGRQTDIVLVVPATDARVLVARAFGENEQSGSAALSTLEAHALERIAARCAATFDPLCAERRGTPQRRPPATLPPCVAYFEVRVTAPIAIELGIGIVRELPDPGPAGVFPAELLARVPVEARVEFASGTLDARTFLALVPGDVIPLGTQVGAPASLKIADTCIARGIGGISGGRYCFEVQSLHATRGRS